MTYSNAKHLLVPLAAQTRMFHVKCRRVQEVFLSIKLVRSTQKRRLGTADAFLIFGICREEGGCCGFQSGKWFVMVCEW